MNSGPRHGGGLIALTLCLGAATLAGCGGHGRYTEAFRKQAAERVSQLKAATQFDMAQQQFFSGDLEKALRSVDQSINLHDGVTRSYVLRARILIEMGHLEEALGTLERATELDPTHAAAHYYRGIVFERFSDFDDALHAFTQAMESDPTSPQYLLASAEMLIELRRLEEAESLLLQRRSSFEHNAGVRQTLGHIESIRGRHQEAAAYFSQAALLAPDDRSITEDLARAQAACGRWTDAESNIRRLLAGATGTPRRDLMHLHVRCLMMLDRPVEARDTLLRLVADPVSGPNDLNAWLALGNVALKINDRHRLRDSAQRIIAIAPELYDGHLLMGMWQRGEGRLEQAARSLERAVALSADDPLPAIAYGIVLSDLGMQGRAAQAFATALRIDPSHQEAQRLYSASLAAQAAALAGATIAE